MVYRPNNKKRSLLVHLSGPINNTNQLMLPDLSGVIRWSKRLLSVSAGCDTVMHTTVGLLF